MAGDWIKITHELPSKPEVLAISQRLGVSRFDVVGRLHALWTWFDQHTEDGHASSVTSVTLMSAIFGDNISSEFANALLDVGWLEEDEGGVYVPNFDRHISESAKTRALSSERQKRRRAGGNASEAKTSRSDRDNTVTREEKRREEETPPCSPPEGDDNAKGSQRSERTLQAKEIFDYWVSRLGKAGNVKFTADRKRKVEARLREGYTVDELKQAVDGILKSPHHMGENEQGVVYDDLGLICRKGEKTDHFIQLASQAKAPSATPRRAEKEL